MRRSGFTLIEVAAAVVILALLIVPLLGARNRTTALAVKTAGRSVAVQLAASKLSEIATKPLAEVERMGRFRDAPGYRWEFSVEPEGEAGVVALYRVRLVIFPDEVEVSTLVIDKEGKE